MDSLDEKLVTLLRHDGRRSISDLAVDLGVSRATVRARIERLERVGVIIGYSVRLAAEHDLGAVRAHVMIKVAPKESRAVEAAVRAIAQVRALHSVSGDFDMIAGCAAPSVAEMDAVIDRIGELDGVERTTSSIILSTKFDR